MGHKVNPKIFRLGTVNSWDSKWFARRDYPKFLQQDIVVKSFLKQELKEASVAKIEIERSAGNMTVIIYSGKPGVIIGRGGQGIEELKKKIVKKLSDKKTTLNVNIKEVSNPAASAELAAQGIVADLEKRVSCRRAMKQAISKVEKTDAKGVKIIVAGRLNGAEIARKETLVSGNLPLNTLRADIDYSQIIAKTIYGIIGVKVWIYKGEKFDKAPAGEDQEVKDLNKEKQK